MRVAAYQFLISNNISKNVDAIKKALSDAKEHKAELVVFAECCLTGYPSRDIDHSSDVDFEGVEEACYRLQNIAKKLGISFLIGTAYKESESVYNRVLLFQPTEMQVIYDKRALWGWDRDNFSIGNRAGIFEFNGIRIGVRICYEVRFPEYFRELYRKGTDLNIIMFYDVADVDDKERYSMIKGHIQTRAVENICTTISVNAIAPFQTAPTAIFGPSGQIYEECPRNCPGSIIYDFEKQSLNFGELGRKELSDLLI